jgi:single-stranded-DNA-specific exonuclease
MNNEKPVFSTDNMEIVYCSAVGADNKHLRLRLTKDGGFFNGIGFSMGAMAEKLRPGMLVNAAFQLDINYYQGTESVQLLLKDIKILN